MVLKQPDFYSFYLVVVVLKELGKFFLKEQFLLSTLGEFSGLKQLIFYKNRTHFNNFYLRRVWLVLKELILSSFYFWEAVAVLKELLLNSFYIVSVWSS